MFYLNFITLLFPNLFIPLPAIKYLQLIILHNHLGASFVLVFTDDEANVLWF